MKAFLTTLLVLCFFTLSLSAQETDKKETKEERQQRYIEEVNPFRDLGYKPKIATLSKGKYREAFPDTIVRIGNIIYNKLSKKVVAIKVTVDIGFSEADLRADLVSRWMSPDPLSEEFPNWSPYNFVENNPIYFTDPTGLAPESPLDDYGIDKKGNITLLKKTDDETDTLYATNTNENGETVIDESAGSVTVSKNSNGDSLLSDLANNDVTEIRRTGEDTTTEIDVDIAVTDESNKDDAFNLFKFVADNSNVEWSLGKIEYQGLGTNYQIGTYHMNNLSPGVRNSSIGTVLGLIHSHPGQTTLSARTESLFGDKSVGRQFLRNHGADKPYLIYFPDNGTASRIGLPSNSNSNGVTIRNGLRNFKF